MKYNDDPDQSNQCNARLYLADDCGDNHATIRCHLFPGHGGPHSESFERLHNHNKVAIMWTVDERDKCVCCGKLGEEFRRCQNCCQPICEDCKVQVEDEYAFVCCKEDECKNRSSQEQRT